MRAGGAEDDDDDGGGGVERQFLKREISVFGRTEIFPARTQCNVTI